MFIDIWNRIHASVCSIRLYKSTGIRVSHLTGFRYKDYIITDDQACKNYDPDEVTFEFKKQDGLTRNLEIRIPGEEFKERIRTTCKNWNRGFLILEAEFPELASIPSLVLSRKMQRDIGHPVAVLGFDSRSDHLSIHGGIISSYYRSKNQKNLIQVDCSIKSGYSGGPLIDARSMEVIGILGQGLASLAERYRKLREIINKNLEILEEIKGKWVHQDIDLAEVLQVGQYQIKHLIEKNYELASFSQGYAMDIDYLVESLMEQGHDDIDDEQERRSRWSV